MDKASIRQELDGYIRTTSGMIAQLQAHNFILVKILESHGLITSEEYKKYITAFKQIVASHGEDTSVTDKAIGAMDVLSLEALLEEANNVKK